jgi:hypothetical protein
MCSPAAGRMAFLRRKVAAAHCRRTTGSMPQGAGRVKQERHWGRGRCITGIIASPRPVGDAALPRVGHKTVLVLLVWEQRAPLDGPNHHVVEHPRRHPGGVRAARAEGSAGGEGASSRKAY